MKQCLTCKCDKSLNDFHNRKDTFDGKETTCKKCRLDKYRAKYVKKKTSAPLNKSQKAERKRHRYIQDAEIIKENNKKWVSKNREHRNKYSKGYTALRRANKNLATLPGFKAELLTFYRNCPDGYHVDHIVPLKGKEVCGLHVPWNLQYLTPEDNLKKGNKLLISVI